MLNEKTKNQQRRKKAIAFYFWYFDYCFHILNFHDGRANKKCDHEIFYQKCKHNVIVESENDTFHWLNKIGEKEPKVALRYLHE